MNLMIKGRMAQEASTILSMLDTEKKIEALLHIAKLLRESSNEILSANAIDVEKAIEKGVKDSLVDRLRLTEARIDAMAEGLEQITQLEDPVGTVLAQWKRPNGLRIRKVRVPFGVIGIIYESRPNVTVDAFGLCFMSGNAVILKGGSDAINSNIALGAILRKGLSDCGITEDAVYVVEDTDRETTKQLMRLNQFVDVLIPRGSANLINTVLENSTIPVIETGTGNCHIYVDVKADLKKAIEIIVNAKTQRMGVCNACESLVVHRDIASKFLPMLADALAPYNVDIRADEEARAVVGSFSEATEEDFGTEYLDRIISVKTVGSVEEAISHINRYHTKHSDAIITKDCKAADLFLRAVDSACVYVNASTRFTDGFEFGFGAEIGISTQKLHARGPMGLAELTSYKYQVVGNGQVRG
ncbi:MAG: glutamate-5-semialdehyde dehydrogenase [Lachnospiraceae bacterium]|jgi:glutamate-5-semialdehyde dehydrogenase|nr:glutamate-5-semialdehyde dehydrogenase [Lachnospiraceae bacterium]